MNRDAQAHLTISSPLEAHKSNTLVFHMVGVDVGFENPMFACLEIDYEVSSNLFCSSCVLLLLNFEEGTKPTIFKQVDNNLPPEYLAFFSLTQLSAKLDYRYFLHIQLSKWPIQIQSTTNGPDLEGMFLK